jgi:hypothetical protein
MVVAHLKGTLQITFGHAGASSSTAPTSFGALRAMRRGLDLLFFEASADTSEACRRALLARQQTIFFNLGEHVSLRLWTKNMHRPTNAAQLLCVWTLKPVVAGQTPRHRGRPRHQRSKLTSKLKRPQQAAEREKRHRSGHQQSRSADGAMTVALAQNGVNTQHGQSARQQGC